MAYIMMNVESDGPIPGDYSMISFGAILVNEKLDAHFYGRLRPISDKFIPEALWVVGDVFKNFNHLRKTTHTHHPVDDARGNAEALLTIKSQYNLKISFS